MGAAVRHAKRKVFERHCHPCSAWTRWLSTPLVLVPVWCRSWRLGAFVAIWFVLNPVVFGKPSGQDAFATRAMLGEELWIDERQHDAAMVVNAVSTAAGIAAVATAWKRRPVPAATFTTTQMALLMIYWRRMVTYYEREQR